MHRQNQTGTSMTFSNKSSNTNFSAAILIIVAFFALFSIRVAAESKPFADKLQAFAPYLGTWESSFEMNGKTVNDVTNFERALNGTTLRVMHSIDNGVYGGESLMFWDASKKKMVFYYFTTAGFYTNGYMEWQDSNTFVAYEDVTGNQSGITKVKSTSKLKGDTMTVATSYLKKGEWTPEQTRTYRRSKKSVVFK